MEKSPLVIVDTETGEAREGTWLDAMILARNELDKIIEDGQQTPDTARRAWTAMSYIAVFLDCADPEGDFNLDKDRPPPPWA